MKDYTKAPNTLGKRIAFERDQLAGEERIHARATERIKQRKARIKELEKQARKIERMRERSEKAKAEKA